MRLSRHQKIDFGDWLPVCTVTSGPRTSACASVRFQTLARVVPNMSRHSLTGNAKDLPISGKVMILYQMGGTRLSKGRIRCPLAVQAEVDAFTSAYAKLVQTEAGAIGNWSSKRHSGEICPYSSPGKGDRRFMGLLSQFQRWLLRWFCRKYWTSNRLCNHLQHRLYCLTRTSTHEPLEGLPSPSKSELKRKPEPWLPTNGTRTLL